MNKTIELTQPIIALDFPSYVATQAFLQQMATEQSLYVKVGMELFYSEGPRLIEQLKQQNHQIFLDLKLYDIPNTVKSAMTRLARLGVDMVNVHAAGGVRMMSEALEGLLIGSSQGKRPQIIAVTQLTSMSEAEMQQSQGIEMSLLDSVLHYAHLAHQASLDGVVCSAQEAKYVKEVTADSFLRVTPGIRLASDSADDQQRIMTPNNARKNGSSYIVVGRSITRANNPLTAYQEVKKQWEMI